MRKRPTETLCAALLAASCVAGAACSPDAPVTGVHAGLSASPAPDAPTAFGRVPDFSLRAQTGELVSAASLRGRPWVAAAIFTTCVGPCPRISHEMRGLQDALEGTDALLVSVSVDPGHDSPEVLAEYADELGADPERWLFLTGPEDDVYALVRDGFKLGVQRADDAPPGAQVTHGTKLVAVDREGLIRGWYESQSDEGVAALRARMLALAAEAE